MAYPAPLRERKKKKKRGVPGVETSDAA